jgi:hypothetical protein
MAVGGKPKFAILSCHINHKTSQHPSQTGYGRAVEKQTLFLAIHNCNTVIYKLQISQRYIVK